METRYRPLALGPSPDSIYLAARPDGDRFALYTYDVASQELGERLFSHPSVDVPDGLIFDRWGRLLGVNYTVDYRETEWLDPEWTRTVTFTRTRITSSCPVRIGCSGSSVNSPD